VVRSVAIKGIPKEKTDEYEELGWKIISPRVAEEVYR